MRIKLTDLAPGVEYAIQVMALNDQGVSPWSKTFTFLTSFDDVPPVEPTGLVGTMSGTTFVLDWQPVVDSMDGTPAHDLSNYYVKVESPGSALTKEYLVPAGETRFQFTLDMNRELFGSPRATIVMSVCAVDKTGNRSTYSSTVSQTNPPPSAPASIVGVELMDSVSLEWSEVDDDDLLGYAIYEGTTSGTQNTKVWAGPGTIALIPSTTYVTDKWYKVFAVDVFGTQSLTGPVAGPLRPKSPFTVDSTAPGVPTGLAGTIATMVDRAALNVSWTNGANPDNDLAGTVIGYRPVGSTDWSYTTVDYTLSSTRIENITPYVNYEIRARAYDWSANYSAWTNTVTTNTAATNTAPPTVTGVVITAGLDSVTVSWAESTADDVKNGAGVYLVQIATNNTFTTGLLEYRTGATQISVTGLAQNQTYYARVKAVDSAGLQSASWSTVVNAGTGDYPEGNPFSYTVSATAPSNPDVGDIWMDTSSGFEKQWNGSNWVNTGNASIDYVDGKTDNLVKNYVTEYSVNSSETVAPTTGWSTATPTRTPGTFIWYRVVVTYGDDTTSTTSPALLTGNTGATGSQGIPGEDGADGQSLYTWLKYADTPTTGMSDSPTGKTYIGLAYNKTNPTESTNYGDYAWSLIKGDQGIPGTPGDDGQSLYTWVKYATSDTGANMSDDPTGKTYIGLAYNKTTATESTTAGDYQWTLFQGPQGDQGIPGTPGDDGVSLYTWIKYADTPTTGMSDTPTGKTYMGIAYNKTSATESTNYADYSWSLIKGADGDDGKGISNTVVNYAKSTNGTTAPSAGWGTAIPTTTTGEFLWTRTVTTYTDASTSTAYSVAAHGATGSTGATGVGVSGTEVRYQKSTSGTTAPTGTWTTAIPLTTTGEFLWTRTITTYTNATTSTAYSVAAHGATGQQGIPGEPGADGVTTYTWVKYADNSSGGGMSDSPTGKAYIGLAFNKTTPTESTTTTDYAWSLIQGPQGTPAPIVSLTATTQVLTSPATGGATTPTTSVVTGTATNTTITVWQYSVNGAAFSNTVPAGVSRTGNVVTITGSTMTAKTITVRMADANGVADTLTVAKVLDGATGATGDPGNPGLPGDPGDPGADAFTVLLTNESHTFPGSTTAALAGSTTTNVIAYEGATLSNATIGTITGQVTGLTTSVTGSGTTNPTITITVTTSLTTKSGTLTIPVTVNGVSFTKRFSWSLALQGSQGIQGLPGDDGTTYYTWLKYADTPTTGMSDSPTGKTYMGIAVNKTSPTESTTYSDYTWSLIKGDQGIPGTPGDDGITYYTWIKYGTSAAGAGLSDDPTGRPYIGIAYNKTTATESTTPGDYTWSLIQGAPGSDGSDGVGITSVTPYFYRITAGSAAPAKPTASPPPAPWTATEPDYLANTELYRTERIIYTDASFAYTNVSKVSAYTAAVTAIASANGKNKVIHSTSAASGTTGYVAGDTWFQYDGSNNIIAQWRYSGSAWVPEQVGSSVIASLDAGKLTANSAFITTLNIGSGGVIQSAGYTSGGTSGFQLSNTGLTIKGTGNVVAVESVAAGTISAKTINIGATGTLNVDSTGQIKSNNYAANSTGYRLSNSGLEINDGSIDAKALRTNTAVIGDLTIGQSANTLGSIKSFGYVAGTTGWKLDKSGLELNTGSVSAAALKIQDSQNLMPLAYADFEFKDGYYQTPFWNPLRGQSQIAISGGGLISVADIYYSKFNEQALVVGSFSAADTPTVWFGTTATDYNVTVEPGEKYIVSMYMWNYASSAAGWKINVKGNNGATLATINGSNVASQTGYVRYEGVFTVPASGVSRVLVGVSTTSTAGTKGCRIDGVQVERVIAGMTTASPWKPPASTTINPSGITTGFLRSQATATVNGTTFPSWSINMDGNLQVSDALIRGKLLVGLSGDPDAGNSYISSGNFVTGATGWKIDSAGNAELNNGTFRGTVDGGTFTGDNFISSGSIYAGTLGGNHTEISSTGLYVYTNTPNEGVIETMRLGANTGDYFAITDSTGTETVTIGSDGGASFKSVSINERVVDVDGAPIGGLFVYGKEFKDWLDEGPRGVVAVGILPVPKTIETNGTIFTLRFEAKPGRTYKFHIPSILAKCIVADQSRGWVVGLEIPTVPGSATLMDRGTMAWGYNASTTANAFYTLPTIERVLRCNPKGIGFGGELNAGMCVIRLSMNATTSTDVEIYGSGSYQRPMLYVEDIGPDTPDTGAYVYEAPSTPPTQTYTSTWVSNSSECYNGSNAVLSNANDLVQGDVSVGNGNCHGLILFTGANSTGSQSGITVATALTGATINKVEVYLYANHWYYGSGGTARIIPDNQSTLAGFTPTGNQKLITGWGRAVGKWVDITSAVTGSGGVGTSLRSVCIGKAPNSDYIYYGRFNAHNQSNPPQLRITYTK